MASLCLLGQILNTVTLTASAPLVTGSYVSHPSLMIVCRAGSSVVHCPAFLRRQEKGQKNKTPLGSLEVFVFFKLAVTFPSSSIPHCLHLTYLGPDQNQKMTLVQ